MESGDIIERYRLIEPLGEGGMGTVWLVEHVALGERHALKVLSPYLVANAGIRERFLDEGRIQARLVHPGIARVTDLVTQGAAGLVMDYVPGPNLAEWLDERGRASAEEAVAILEQLLAAVGLAHERGVIHRDLKPENILMRNGELDPVLVDFGIAKLETEGKGKTRTGTSMGTPGYMPPEQIRDSSKVDARCDIYSLGVILHELLSGEPRFRGDSGIDITLAVMNGEHATLPNNVPQHLRVSVGRATQPAPAHRFESAREFAGALLGPPKEAPLVQELRSQIRQLKEEKADFQRRLEHGRPVEPQLKRRDIHPARGIWEEVGGGLLVVGLGCIVLAAALLCSGAQ